MPRFDPGISVTILASATTLAFPIVDGGDSFRDSHYSSDRSESSAHAPCLRAHAKIAFGRKLFNLGIAGSSSSSIAFCIVVDPRHPLVWSGCHTPENPAYRSCRFHNLPTGRT